MKTEKLTPLALLALLVFSLGFTGCNKNGEEPNSEFTINFQALAQGNEYSLNEVYRSVQNIDIKFEIFQFYLSDITLVNSDGDERLISEIELFKFDGTGKSSHTFQVPHGDYVSIKFGIGVKKELNEADPANYAIEGHPLNTLENTYWGWAGMYRFITSEGRIDSDLDGVYDGTFAYHTGREISYRMFDLSHDFEVKKKDANALNLNVHLDQLFDKTGNEVDLTTEPFYHGSTENESITVRISDNMLDAIYLAN